MSFLTRCLLILLVATGALALSAPAASAFTCSDPTNPFPPAPVGGEVGRTYTTATGTTYDLAVFGEHLGCGLVFQAISTVNAQCDYLVGDECITVA